MPRANHHARIKREPGYQPQSRVNDEDDDNLTVDFAPSEVERRMQRSDARKFSLIEFTQGGDRKLTSSQLAWTPDLRLARQSLAIWRSTVKMMMNAC